MYEKYHLTTSAVKWGLMGMCLSMILGASLSPIVLFILWGTAGFAVAYYEQKDGNAKSGL